jgi:radical SAM superfamily enzyme YgiQ (UPF0313 family)
MDNTIVMVASGMKKPKKEYNTLNELNLYLNYGLLGLATQLHNKGYKTRMFQGDYKSINELILDIEDNKIDITRLKYPIFISTPSFFSISWANDFSLKIKELNKDVKIIVGGRWIIDNNFDWIKIRMPNVDTFIKGYGEHCIEDYLYEEKKTLEKTPLKKVSPFNELNYYLLHDFEKYQPCIEISRGCGMGCEFCLEGDIKAIPSKKPEIVINEALDTMEKYNSNTLNFYFQASIFNPSTTWSKEFSKLYRQKELLFNWRFETRVDTLNPDSLSFLASAGLKVIDLGLESASPIQLSNMGKTKDAIEYLGKAEKVLKTAYENNIWTKVNIILYPGETNKTINETLSWLNKNKKFIKGVSVNPLFLYRNGKFTEPFINTIEKLNDESIEQTELDKNGYMLINLSEEIDIEKAKELSFKISKQQMSIGDYYDLKSVSYYSRRL